MGIEEKKRSKEINGVVYEVAPLPFSIGKVALLKFSKIATPVIAQVLGSDGNHEAAVASAIATLPALLTEEDLNYFTTEFGKQSKYKVGDKMVPMTSTNIELHFAAEYGSYFKWLAFCVEVNFGGFFAELLQGSLVSVASPAAPTS